MRNVRYLSNQFQLDTSLKLRLISQTAMAVFEKQTNKQTNNLTNLLKWALIFAPSIFQKIKIAKLRTRLYSVRSHVHHT